MYKHFNCSVSIIFCHVNVSYMVLAVLVFNCETIEGTSNFG